MTEAKRQYFGGGRKPTGTLIRNKSGYSAKVWAIVDGERVRVTKPLGTDSRAAAKVKLARLLASDDPNALDLSEPETFEVATGRFFEARTSASSKDERARLKRYAFPELGARLVTKVNARHINAALDACKAAGKSRSTVQQLKQDIANVFTMLKREGVVERNPADDAEIPRYKATQKKERAVLTDDELAIYLAYEPPPGAFKKPVLERQTMACVSRMFGGLRTGDLHAIRWESFDLETPFAWGWAPRQKTKRPQRLAIPNVLRVVLAAWWETHGKPKSGPVFPSRRGESAGKAKGKVSHAKAFRRDLARALGVETPSTQPKARSNGRALLKVTWKARAMTPRERELFEETDATLPVDFHSWRRAYTQALADAGVTAQQAQALAGHASLEAHARYLANSAKLRVIPDEALPKLAIEQKSKPRTFAGGSGSKSSRIPSRRDRGRTCDSRCVKPELYR